MSRIRSAVLALVNLFEKVVASKKILWIENKIRKSEALPMSKICDKTPQK
jgi:hypothetical protein